jgi:hypothetical protein
MLTRAGADVLLVRKEEAVMSPLERLENVNNFGAEIYVAIGHGAADQSQLGVLDESERLTKLLLRDITYVGHYPKGEDGKRLAQNIAQFISRLRDDTTAQTFPSVTYMLTQTACPAVAVHVLEPTSFAAEQLVDASSFQRTEAYAIYNGILSYYGFVKEGAAQLTGRVVGKEVPRPVRGAMVIVDDYLSLETESDGRFEFDLLPPGKHALMVRPPRGEIVKTEVVLEANRQHDVTIAVPGWIPPRESVPFRPASSVSSGNM